VILLGNYKLDVEEMLLSRDGEKVALEPKVLEVLLYFIANKERYITMKELHESLWQGRIVSDAAVRRIISKLRMLFNDDHKVPRYIKSLSKRGYKLICNVEQPTEPTLSPDSASKNNNTLIDIVHNKNKTLLKDNRIYRKYLFLTAFIVSVMLIANFIYLDFNTNKITEDNTLVINKVIKSLPGEKIAVSQSLDNQFLAFSGKVNEDQGYQIFIKKNNSHDFMAIKANTFLPLSLAFSVNSKNLFYSDLKEGDSSLNIISLTDSLYRKEVLLKNYFSIGNIFTPPNDELIYFSGQKHQDEPRLIYSYNINTKTTKQITHSAQNYSSDIRGSISPNGELLAIARYSLYEKVYKVRVINLISKDIIFHHNPKSNVYDLKWIDNQHLLLLDEEQLLSLNIKSSKDLKVIFKPHNLATFQAINSQRILAIQYHRPKKIFFEQTLPFKNWDNKFIYNDEADVGLFSINRPIDNNSKLIMTYKDNITSLSKLDTRTAEITSYLKTEYELKHIEYSTFAKMELIKINHRFALFDIKNKNFTYITSADEFIGDASFSIDGKSILFSIKNYDQWEIKSYEITKQSITNILKGFRYIRPYKKDYILADDQGNLYFYNNTTQEKFKLDQRISYEPNTYWTVRGDFIYWSHHDLVTTTFSELNISDIKHTELTQKTFDYNKTRPYFSITSDASSLTYSQRGQENSTIVSLVIK
jgi:DNA-binding winged helix-turn-helix (wHTH) protein/Tol biopolymer transport system component